MDIHELSNSEIEVSVGPKKYKIKRLSLHELLSDFGKEVKQEYLEDIKNTANMIDAKERTQFIQAASKDMPRGYALDEAINERMTSLSGVFKIMYKALNKYQKVDMDEIEDLCTNAKYKAEYTIIQNYVMGIKPEVDSSIEVKAEDGPKKL